MRISKNLILEACLQKQNILIESFKSKLEVMESDAFLQDQSPSQTENRAPGKIELLNAVAKELDFAQREMELLKNLNPNKENTVVEPGAVVVTDKLTFYICVSIEKFEVQGHPLFGISTKAPIYESMRGLEKGASFSFNETKYQIKDVY
jgi:hypothetical protein